MDGLVAVVSVVGVVAVVALVRGRLFRARVGRNGLHLESGPARKKKKRKPKE
jgi:hypothetical protein